MLTRAVTHHVAVRAAVVVVAVLAFAIAFPKLHGWNPPVAFTAVVCPIFVAGALLGWVGGASGGLVITTVVVFWNTRLEPTTLIAMVPLA